MTLAAPLSRWATIGVFAALMAFYLASDPSNRFESIDGYDYAQAAEIVPLHQTYDSRSILFHKINRVIFLASQKLGLPFDAHRLIRMLCMATAAGSVLLFLQLLTTGFGLALPASRIAAAMLAVSYGFWRYAVEVEVYLPSIFLILLTIRMLLDGLEGDVSAPVPFLLAGAVGGAGCLYYQANCIPLCIAAPVLLLGRDRWRALAGYAAGGTLVAVGGLVAAYLASESEPLAPRTLYKFLSMRFDEFNVDRSVGATVVGSVSAILHDVVSINWLYAFDGFRAFVERMMPSHSSRLEGISYAAMRFAPWVYAGAVLMPAIAAGALLALVTAVHRGLPRELTRVDTFLVVWLAANLACYGILGASEPEVWVTTLPVIMAVLAIWIVEPLVKAGHGRLLWLLPAAMLLHNYVGGIGMFQSADSSHRAKTKWLATELTGKDAILVNKGDQRIWNYLRYRLGATLIYSDGESADVAAIDQRFHPQRESLAAMLQSVRTRGGRVFTIGDLSRPDPAMRHREGVEEYRRALKLATRLEGQLDLAYDGDAAKIYVVRP